MPESTVKQVSGSSAVQAGLLGTTVRELYRLAREVHPLRRYYQAKKAVTHSYYRVRYRGAEVFCPCCGGESQSFVTVDRLCRFCRSYARNRFLWTYLVDRLKLGDNVLHFAPEPCLQDRLRGRPGIGYISADLFSGLADVHLDMTNHDEVESKLGLHLYSIILCSHVLEHIDDDPAAMRAIRNLLRKDGRALIQVPLDWSREVTYEDFSITTPEARTRAFGQWDHVRIYGRDFMDRLQAVGLEVELVYPRDVCTDEAIVLMQLDSQDPIFLCRGSASLGFL